MTLMLVLLASVAMLFAQESHDHNQTGGKVFLLPASLEVKLALNALPGPLRKGAAVLVLEQSGYRQVQAGTNPFTCIVSRRGGNFYPVCFDKEGTATIMVAFMDDAVMRLRGSTEAEIDSEVARRFASGHYRPPSRPGIAYMLSPAIYMMANGKLARNTPPHTMFYAPYLTDADIGGMMGRTPFVDRPGPHGMIIVVAGQSERETYAKEAADLLVEVEPYVQGKVPKR